MVLLVGSVGLASSFSPRLVHSRALGKVNLRDAGSGGLAYLI
jgi:hypothetical protein